MNNKRIVFMGTPIFAAEILNFLIDNNLNIVGVVSQPDREKDRKRNLKPTPVKEIANKHNIKVYQPQNVKKDLTFLEECKPELIITAAYGQIISDEILNYPKYKCINVHGSLLPKYRGGAPIHYAILNGDNKTGVTIMEMIKEMDAGDIISQESFPIEKDDTLEVVHNNMIEVAKKLLLETLPIIFQGKYETTKQNEKEVTFSPTIKKKEQKIDFTKNGIDIYNKIRAFNPWPVAYSTLNGKRIKFYKSTYESTGNKKNIGHITNITSDGIEIGVVGGVLKLQEFQIEGKPRCNIKDFINGNNIFNIKDKFE